MDHPIVIEAILGAKDDPGLAERLHHLVHHGAVETLFVQSVDLPRRRFHGVTDEGTACFVALPRSAPLFDGAVLHIDDGRAIILRVGHQEWLRLLPSPTGALQLGYLAGTLHWRVRFEDGCLLVARDRPLDEYLARLAELRRDGDVSIVE
jgi:urease accessory protein